MTRQIVLSDREARYWVQQLERDPTAPPPTAHAASQDSPLVRQLVRQLANAGLPAPRAYPDEVTFTGCGLSGVRRWKLDLAWEGPRVVCEVEGGLWGSGRRCPTCHRAHGGRHTSPAGFERDCIKYTELALAGWLLVRATPPMIADGRALRYIEAALAARGGSSE